jgi:aminoglycoside phosphotransferase family enzyme
MSELPELVQALLEPRAYPEPPQRVELVQTQISYVFLAGELVYKIKKPVDFGFLDYTTLEKRLYFCRREVELNRRLCPEAYLGVVPVTADNGKYTIDGKGKTEEYAVKMRRLPREAMMDVLLTENRITPAMIEKVAGILVAFHRKAATGGEINTIGGINGVKKNTSENFEQTEKYAGTIISEPAFRCIRDYTEGFIRENAALFRRREAGGRVRDCHGDLHAAHICFGEKICIYDCIEFIDRLRYTDVAAEIAFLAMDLDHFGRQDLSAMFVKDYVAKSGDSELMELLDFYKCYRAYVRGKVGCSQYDDPHIPAGEKEKILATTKGYFELAESYIEK